MASRAAVLLGLLLAGSGVGGGGGALHAQPASRPPRAAVTAVHASKATPRREAPTPPRAAGSPGTPARAGTGAGTRPPPWRDPRGGAVDRDGVDAPVDSGDEETASTEDPFEPEPPGEPPGGTDADGGEAFPGEGAPGGQEGSGPYADDGPGPYGDEEAGAPGGPELQGGRPWYELLEAPDGAGAREP